MRSGNQAGDWRVRLEELRTQKALCAAAPAEDAVRRLSDRALQAAAVNPDHSAAARAAAAVELAARGGGVEQWRPNAPTFLRERDLARGLSLFFGLGRRVRVWSGFAAAAALTGACVAGAVAAATHGAGAEQAVLACAAAASVAGLIWFFASLLRARPARLWVLRPPRGAATDAPLARMVARELRPFGHVVTLARAAEAGAVRTAADFRARVAALANRIGMNAAAMLARDAMSLSATQAWRGVLLDLAATSSDAVVVDLSVDGDEIVHAMAERGALARCVFVSIWGGLAAAETVLQTRGIAAPCFYYAPDGEMQRRDAFRAAILSAVRGSRELRA